MIIMIPLLPLNVFLDRRRARIVFLCTFHSSCEICLRFTGMLCVDVQGPCSAPEAEKIDARVDHSLIQNHDSSMLEIL